MRKIELGSANVIIAFGIRKPLKKLSSLAGFGLLICCFCLSACKPEVRNSKNYLFLGHTYQWGVKDNNRIDYRLEDLDFGKYDQIWLGGDLCARTNEDTATLDYLDSIFDLSAPGTHWALGNHDVKYGPLEWIEQRTGRKSFYSSHFNGINLMVLNTNEFYHPNYQPKPEECDLLARQMKMLTDMADTISVATHLIVLHHHCLLTNKMTDSTLILSRIFNWYMHGLKVDCENALTFEAGIYPILQRVQEKGVQVILIGGDLGQRSKSFEYRSKEGIWFLGSGINNSAIDIYLPEYVTDTSADKVLLFEHQMEQAALQWKFVELEKWIETEGLKKE